MSMRFAILVLSLSLTSDVMGSDYAKTLRDPTKPLSGRSLKAGEQGLVLQAIFIGEGRKEAIINGQLVGEGDKLGNTNIFRINEKTVVYAKNGRKGTLRLRKGVFE